MYVVRKYLMFVFLLLCSVILLRDSLQHVDAHPGRTDANGCHTCRTNCAKWGLAQGEYHCHGGSSSNSTNGDTNRSQSSSVNSAIVQQEEQARLQAEKEEKEKQAQIAAEKQKEAEKEAEKIKGEQAGYQYRMDHPDQEQQDLAGYSDFYVEGYQNGIARAEKDLIDKTRQLADEHAKVDASTLLTPSEEVPAGVKTELYLVEYKEKFESYEHEYFDDIKLDAQHSAQIDVYDGYGKGAYEEEIEDKGKIIYKETYEDNFAFYTNEIESVKAFVKETGFADGRNGKEKTDASYLSYENYKVFTEFQRIYDAAYEEGRNYGTFTTIVSGMLIVLMIYLVIRRRKKKRAKLKG